MPYCPDDGDDGAHWETVTHAEKLVADYCGIPLSEVWELCWYTYRLLLRDAVIEKLSSTSGGREYLKKCWILEQTEPDRKRLRQEFGKGG